MGRMLPVGRRCLPPDGRGAPAASTRLDVDPQSAGTRPVPSAADPISVAGRSVNPQDNGGTSCGETPGRPNSGQSTIA